MQLQTHMDGLDYIGKAGGEYTIAFIIYCISMIREKTEICRSFSLSKRFNFMSAYRTRYVV